MSNGVGDSRAPYIIICDTRTRISTAETPSAKVTAATSGAAQLASFMELRYGDRLKTEDLVSISELQHEMMDNVHTYDVDAAEAVCREMVRRLYELEEKFISGR